MQSQRLTSYLHRHFILAFLLSLSYVKDLSIVPSVLYNMYDSSRTSQDSIHFPLTSLCVCMGEITFICSVYSGLPNNIIIPPSFAAASPASALLALVFPAACTGCLSISLKYSVQDWSILFGSCWYAA